MLIKCPECAREVSDTAPSCPGCGYLLAKPVVNESSAPAPSAAVAQPTIGSPPAAKPARNPPVMTSIAILLLIAGVFFPRFLIAVPVFGCIGLCAGAIARKEGWRPLTVIVGLLAVGLLLLSSVPARSLASEASVSYLVSGSARQASLTIQNESGGTEQLDYVALPWTRTVSVKSGDFVYVSAQNKGDYGSISCTITVNGSPLKESTSEGAYSIASCSGEVP